LGISNSEAEQLRDLFETEFTDGFTGTITFDEDGTYSTDFGNEIETGTWALNGSTLILNPDIASDGPTNLTVLSLNSSSSSFEFSETETVDLDDDGSNETLSMTIRMTFSKN
jgi:hypothetical protein